MKKLLIILLLLLVAVPCFGKILTFTWDANTESDLQAYNLYRNGQYVKTIPKTETSCTEESQPGVSAYYLTAFDTSGNESEPSKAIYYVETSVTTDTTPPAKVNFTVTIQPNAGEGY